MGRQLRPIRVHLLASRMLESGRLKAEPPWYRVVGAIPPTTSLVRPLPIQLNDTVHSKSARRTSNTFRPQKIVYPEDELRKTFFKDHPWELARPRIVLENDGRDAERWDWSRLKQLGRQTDGESVVQHQLWLLENHPDLTTRQAYDIARKKFYQIRLEEDIQRRIAAEEALSVGAAFDKYYIDMMYEREGQVLQDWRTKAAADLSLRKHRRNAAYSTTSIGEDAAAKETAASTTQGQPAVPAPAAASGVL